MNEESQTQINALLEKVSMKYATGTAKGKIRKSKIMKKFCYNHKWVVNLVCGVYETVLIIFKTYVQEQKVDADAVTFPSDTSEIESKGEENASDIYKLLKYFKELARLRLPFCLLWSNLLLGNLNRFSDTYQ